MPVIAMTQEMASLGKDVARIVASQLGLTVIRNEISEQISGKVNKPKSAIRRYLEGHANVRERLGTSRRSLSVYSTEEVFDHAFRGNALIRGWGGNYLLRPVSHVLSIRVCAPMEQRIDWLMKRLDIDEPDFAEEEIRRSDAAHAVNTHHWFRKTWGNPLDYDLVINTSRVSVDSAAQLIVNAMQQPEFQETNTSRQKLVDLMTEARCRSALLRNPTTQRVHVTVESQEGRVRLSGIVDDGEERKACEKIASDVPDVQSVDNQLKAMTDFKIYR